MICDGDVVVVPIAGHNFAISQSQEPVVSVKGEKVNGAKCDLRFCNIAFAKNER